LAADFGRVPPPASAAAVLLAATGRGIALFLGLFALLNLLGGLRSPGLNMNLWWVDLSPLPGWASRSLLFVAACSLLAYASGFARLRWLHLVVGLGLLGAALLNTAAYYRLLHSGALHAGPAVPFSALVAAALLVVVLALARSGGARLGRAGRVGLALVFLMCAGVFPVAQIYSFGATDYRRKADAIVVFGAAATADDRPSLALSDRVRTACALYHQGYAPLLIFSGGPTPPTGHETEAMRRYAVRLGVPNQDILLDRQGLSTHDTVRNTVSIFAARRLRRVLAVSHFYHLPRIKMCYRRAGWEVLTVPVEDPRQPRSEFAFMAFRETVAMWAYYLLGR
jgi:uncharacterized SAM-binding protein YcdF (DUF218 family)